MTGAAPGPAITYQFKYDGLGRRVWQGGALPQTFYIFDGDLLIGEVAPSGFTTTPMWAYTWGANGLIGRHYLPSPYAEWYH